jgi:hypothetical protein
MNHKQKHLRNIRAKRQADLKRLNDEGVIFPALALLVDAIQPSERGTGCVDDAGYLNIRDGAIVFALPEGCDIDLHPNGNDDIDYRAGRAVIDKSPADWIKIPKVPMNYGGSDRQFMDQFIAEISEKYGLIVRLVY